MSGVPYHAWTHRPKDSGGTDPIEMEAGGYPYIYRSRNSNQLIEAGSVEYIDWDVDDFDESGGHFSTDDNFACNVIGPGVFDFLCGMYWGDAFNSMTMLQIECDAFGWTPTVYGKPRLYTSGGSVLDSVGALFVHFQARMPSGNSRVACVTGHENAANKNISYAFLRIAYITSYAGDADSDFAFL